MSVKIRLQRHGKKGKPFYWVVVADARSKRDGRYLEKIGTYNPNTNPATLKIDVDNAVNWLQNGAQPTASIIFAVGFTKELELVGVGYRASNQGQKLDLALGFSHNIVFEIPSEVKVETISEKGKNPIIKLSSHDNQLVGTIAAKIRGFRKPEPYKGKGVKFVGEQIRRKAGKSA